LTASEPNLFKEKKMKYSEIKRALNSAAINPAKDPMMKIVADVDNADYFTNRAIEEIKLADRSLDRDEYKERLTMALTLLAMAIVKQHHGT
jgi:hypothetical protein